MNEKIKVSYSVGNYNKFIAGRLVAEDEHFMTVLSRDNKQYKVRKDTIIEEVRE